MYRLISYNVHSGVGRDGIQDYDRIGQFLASQNADFVLLQEMDTRSKEREIQADINAICAHGHFVLIPAVTVKTEHGWFGNAILSRHPVLHHQQFDISVDNREPRTVQHVITDVGGDRHINILNAHLGLKKAERKYQVRRLDNIVQSIHQEHDRPTCIGGDMNEWWLKTRLFKRLDSHLRQLPTGRSFPSQLPLLKLDRVWSSKELEILESCRLMDESFSHFSDHLPVKVDFSLNQLSSDNQTIE